MSPLPDFVIVTDNNGTPDFAVAPSEILDDGFTLASRLGTAHGDVTAINDALFEALDKWDGNAQYVLLSALKTLAADILPEMTAATAQQKAGQ